MLVALMFFCHRGMSLFVMTALLYFVLPNNRHVPSICRYVSENLVFFCRLQTEYPLFLAFLANIRDAKFCDLVLFASHEQHMPVTCGDWCGLSVWLSPGVSVCLLITTWAMPCKNGWTNSRRAISAGRLPWADLKSLHFSCDLIQMTEMSAKVGVWQPCVPLPNYFAHSFFA